MAEAQANRVQIFGTRKLPGLPALSTYRIITSPHGVEHPSPFLAGAMRLASLTEAQYNVSMAVLEMIETESGEHALRVDGEMIRGAIVHGSSESASLTLPSDVIDPRIRLDELLALFIIVRLSYTLTEQGELPFNIGSQMFLENESKTVRLRYDFEFDPYKWDRAYAIADLADSVLTVSTANTSFVWEYSEDGLPQVSTVLPGHTYFGTVTQLSYKLFESIRLAHEQLATHGLKDSIAVNFSFPPTIKSACEQYLIYFAQFLRDLGIEANTELREEAGKVLFSVTPTDRTQALDAIRSALVAYLRLPSAPDYYQGNRSNDIAMAQLRANIFHLQSGFELAKAEIQARDATIQGIHAIIQGRDAVIQAKDATIAAQQSHIAGLQDRLDLTKSIPEPAPASKSDAHETESVIEDLVAVKPYDFKFVSVNVPEILRRLKRRFQ